MCIAVCSAVLSSPWAQRLLDGHVGLFWCEAAAFLLLRKVGGQWGYELTFKCVSLNMASVAHEFHFEHHATTSIRPYMVRANGKELLCSVLRSVGLLCILCALNPAL